MLWWWVWKDTFPYLPCCPVFIPQIWGKVEPPAAAVISKVSSWHLPPEVFVSANAVVASSNSSEFEGPRIVNSSKSIL